MTDLALINANVLTMDLARPRASAVAIAGGRITALDEVPAGAARVVDLRGATVLPGFHDAHNHMVGFGMSLAEVDLRSSAAGTLDELYAAVARRAETTAAGGLGGRLRLRPEQDRRPPAPGRPRPGRAGAPGLAAAHLGTHVRGEQPGPGRPRPRRGRHGPARRPGRHRRGRPSHRPARGTGPALGGEPGLPIPAGRADRGHRPGGRAVPEGGHHQLHRGRHRRRLGRAQPGRARRLPGRQGPGQARGPGRADDGQRGPALPRRARRRRPGRRARPGHQDRLRRRLAPARRGEDIRRRVPGRPDRRPARRLCGARRVRAREWAGLPAGRRGRVAGHDHRRAPLRLAGRHARDRRPGHRRGARRVRAGAGRSTRGATRGTGSSTSPWSSPDRWRGPPGSA